MQTKLIFLLIYREKNIHFRSVSHVPTSKSYSRHLVKFHEKEKKSIYLHFFLSFLKKGSNSSSFTSFFFILKEEAIFFSLLSLFFCIWPGHPPGYYLESWLWTPALEPGWPLALPNLADPNLLVFLCWTVGRLLTQPFWYFQKANFYLSF